MGSAAGYSDEGFGGVELGLPPRVGGRDPPCAVMSAPWPDGDYRVVDSLVVPEAIELMGKG